MVFDLSRSEDQEPPIRVAVVGASIADSPDGRDRWAIRAHLPALLGMKDRFELAAVCTSRTESARATAQRFGIEHFYGSIDEMLNDVDVDAVCISLQPQLHFDAAMSCVEAGKHVYVEQPFCANTQEAATLAGAARRRRLRTIVGHRNAHVPQVVQMAKLVEEGFVGEPLTFQFSSFVSGHIQPRPRHRTWLFQSSTGRPSYRSALAYDRVTAVLGSPVDEVVADIATRVQSRPSMDGGEPITGDLPNNMSFLVRLQSGISGTIQISKTAWFGDKERLDIYGTKGMLRLTSVQPETAHSEDLKAYNSKGLRLLGARANVEDVIEHSIRPESMGHPAPIDPQNDFVTARPLDPDQEPFIVGQAWMELRRAIATGTEARASFGEGVRVHQVLDAAEESASTGGWAKVDYESIADLANSALP